MMIRDNQTIGAMLSAVLLVLLTIAVAVFGVVNFQQRLAFDVPDDGITWLDGGPGVHAAVVTPDSPGERAGIKPGDVLVSVDGQPVSRSIDVVKRLWGLGIWSRASYQLSRQNRVFDTAVIIAPAPKPLSLENYLRVVGLLYLFIGLFIFVRRWNAPARGPLLSVLPGLVRPLLLSLHGQAERLRLGSLLGQGRCPCRWRPPCWSILRWSSRREAWRAKPAQRLRIWRLLICRPRLVDASHLRRHLGLLGFVPSFPRASRSINWSSVYLGSISSWRRRFSCTATCARPADSCGSS